MNPQPPKQSSGNYVVPIVIMGLLLVGGGGFLLYTLTQPKEAAEMVPTQDREQPITVFRERHRCGDGVRPDGSRVPRFGYSVKSVEECFATCTEAPNMAPNACNHVSFYAGKSHEMLYHGLNCVVNSSGCTSNHESVGHTDGKGLSWHVYQR